MCVNKCRLLSYLHRVGTVMAKGGTHRALQQIYFGFCALTEVDLTLVSCRNLAVRRWGLEGGGLFAVHGNIYNRSVRLKNIQSVSIMTNQ